MERNVTGRYKIRDEHPDISEEVLLLLTKRTKHFPTRKIVLQSNPKKASLLRHFMTNPTPEQKEFNLKWEESDPNSTFPEKQNND